MSDNQDVINVAGRAQKTDAGGKNFDKRIPEKLNFLTPKVITVLGFFIAYPLKEYYEREVARKTGVSRGSAHKILVKLANVDFLTREILHTHIKL